MLLKQSTAVILKIGPFVDSTDGATPETGLTIAQADIQIAKAGAAFAQTSNASPTTTHDADGWYPIPFTATDTGTLGKITVQVAMAGALQVWREYDVVPANVYDSLVAGSDTLQADLTQMGGVAQSATDLKNFADAGYDPATNKVQGVVLVGTTTTNTDMVAAAPTAVQNRQEIDSNSTQLAAVLVDTGTDIPARFDGVEGAAFATGTDSLEALRNRGDAAWVTGGDATAANQTTIAGLIAALNDPSLAAIVAGIWDEAQAGHGTAGTFGYFLDALVSAVSAPTVAQIDTELSSTHGAGSWLSGAGGSGSVSFGYTVTDSQSSAPLADTAVWVTTDAAGLNIVAGTLFTNNFGIVTFTLDPGTYYFWRKKGGYDFENPDTEVVS